MGPDSTPKVFHPGPKQRSTGDVWWGRAMVLVGSVVMQKTVVNDKMSIENSGATPNSNRKFVGKKGSKGDQEIHAYTRRRSFYNSIHPIHSYPVYRGGKGKKE